jgi:hypothetical protein
MANVLENIKEVRKDCSELFDALDVAMISDERAKAADIERKLAEIEKEIGIFFSGQI